jgi:hypothetical protein
MSKNHRSHSLKNAVAAAAGSAAAGAVVTPALAGALPAYDEIASLAYRYWEEGGRQENTAEEDWYRAEETLRRTLRQGEE